MKEKYSINDVTNEQLSYILSSVKNDMYGSATINIGLDFKNFFISVWFSKNIISFSN